MKVGIISLRLIKSSTSISWMMYHLRLLTLSISTMSLSILFFVSKNYHADRPISSETTTFIERDIFMTAEDAEERNPYVWIEQRTFESGKETINARQLFFLERVTDGNVYIFKGCGDQILGIEKLPDLHLTARVVSNPTLAS